MTEASVNGGDNYSDEEDQDLDIDDLEFGAHYKNPFLQILKRNHVQTVGLI